MIKLYVLSYIMLLSSIEIIAMNPHRQQSHSNTQTKKVKQKFTTRKKQHADLAIAGSGISLKKQVKAASKSTLQARNSYEECRNKASSGQINLTMMDIDLIEQAHIATSSEQTVKLANMMLAMQRRIEEQLGAVSSKSDQMNVQLNAISQRVQKVENTLDDKKS